MNDIIKWGIIGLGNIAYGFSKSFDITKNAKLTAVASKTPDKLSKFKNEFKPTLVFGFTKFNSINFFALFSREKEFFFGKFIYLFNSCVSNRSFWNINNSFKR